MPDYELADEAPGEARVTPIDALRRRPGARQQ